MTEDAADKPDVSEENPESDRWIWTGKHRPPIPKALLNHMLSNWADDETDPGRHPGADNTAARRAKLSAAFKGKNLVIPTGTIKARNNDSDYRFRPGSDYYWLCGGDAPDAVLVMKADGDSHTATVYVEPSGDRSTHRFFSDARYGELWTGARLSPAATARYLGLETAPKSELDEVLRSLGDEATLVVRDIDPQIDALFAADDDGELAAEISSMRLTKDAYEVDRLQEAVDATVRGFEDVVRALPEAMEQGERVVEGVFNLRARVDGNDAGYQTIAASGTHATILHWTRNDGEVRSGDLLLLDAGVEVRDLYTADVTRTIPISGKFTAEQREIYDLVYRAHGAAIATIRPGVAFSAPHAAAMKVLTLGLHELGIIDVDPEVALRRDQQLYRRYTLHGTSHMLGLDVHDCGQARDKHYMGELKEGYVLTVEPGLYFQPHDLTVPEKYRGIGVRIEDDVLVTADGCRVLSAGLPTDPDEIEAWMRGLGHNQPGGKSGLLGGQ